jgi:hypothetical protein
LFDETAIEKDVDLMKRCLDETDTNLRIIFFCIICYGIKYDEVSVNDKAHTGGIEGNNCRLRHRIGRALRKTGVFLKS